MNETLKEEWLAFELLEFPAGCAGREAGGMKWEQVDAVAAACISTFLSTGTLDAECLGLLDGAIVRLAEIAAVAEEEHRPYFDRLFDLARQSREAAHPAGGAR